MNTPTISAALPAAPSSPERAQTGSSDQANAGGPSFSTVLTRQQGPRPAQVAAAPAEGAAAGIKGEPDAKADAKPGAAESADEEALAQLASEQGLSLPQIALNIAAEAALAVAAQRPGAARAVTPGSAGAAGAAPARDLPAGDLPAALARGADADAETAQAKAGAVPAQAGKNARLQSAALPQTNIAPGAGGKAVPLPAGFIPVQAAAAPHQTELNARKAGSPTGARQTQLAAQAQIRAADDSPGKAPAAEFSAIMANAAASKASASAAASQADLSAAQAGAISVAGASANATPLSGNTSPVVNSGAQPALPGIATPLQSPQWASDFGRQFVSLTQGGHNMPHTAELRLDPPELGPLRISINISDNVAHAIFASPHAAVRQTVENALPQLQQLLAQAGISLGQTSVSDQGQSEQAFNESFGASRKSSIGAADGAAAAADLSARPAARGRAPDALVDTFA